MKTAKEIVDELEIDFDHFTMDYLFEVVEKKIGRNIYCIPLPMPPGHYGTLVSDAEKPNEYIFYRASLPKVQTSHVQIHEIGHILNEDQSLKITSNDIAEIVELITNPSEENARKILKRSDESDIEKVQSEKAAEEIAVEIQTRIIKAKKIGQLSSFSKRADIDRFVRDMGGVS